MIAFGGCASLIVALAVIHGVENILDCVHEEFIARVEGVVTGVFDGSRLAGGFTILAEGWGSLVSG